MATERSGAEKPKLFFSFSYSNEEDSSYTRAIMFSVLKKDHVVKICNSSMNKKEILI
jgi:hypothetical protein